ISGDIAARGGWRIDPADPNSYNQKLPGFSLLWSAVTSVGGLSPLAHVQLIMPLIASLAVIPAYLFGVKATGRRLGGFVAGLFVLAQRRAIARGRFSLVTFVLDVATGPALAIPAWAYYSAVDLPFLADLLAADALVLFLGIVILLTALIVPLARPTRLRIGQR